MRYFTPNNGAKLRVDDAGGDGMPVIFQHGLCGNAAQPAEVFPGDSAYRRITIECRGHGESQCGDPADFSMAQFSDDIAAFIVAKHLAPVVLGGISMGAAISLRLAVRRPELIRGLIIARPAWLADSNPRNCWPNVEVGQLLQHYPPQEALARFNESDTAKLLAMHGPDNLVSLRSFFTREPIIITASLLTSIASDGPGVSEAEIASVAVPTLVIGHALDHIHPYAMATEIAQIIPGAQLAEITPKAVDKARYVQDFQLALQTFLKGFT